MMLWRKKEATIVHLQAPSKEELRVNVLRDHFSVGDEFKYLGRTHSVVKVGSTWVAACGFGVVCGCTPSIVTNYADSNGVIREHEFQWGLISSLFDLDDPATPATPDK